MLGLKLIHVSKREKLSYVSDNGRVSQMRALLVVRRELAVDYNRLLEVL